MLAWRSTWNGWQGKDYGQVLFSWSNQRPHLTSMHLVLLNLYVCLRYDPLLNRVHTFREEFVPQDTAKGRSWNSAGVSPGISSQGRLLSLHIGAALYGDLRNTAKYRFTEKPDLQCLEGPQKRGSLFDSGPLCLLIKTSCFEAETRFNCSAIECMRIGKILIHSYRPSDRCCCLDEKFRNLID